MPKMPRRGGFSLLEAILALAILGVSLAALSQVMGTGVDAGLEANDLAMCRMAATAKMNEVLIDIDLGVTPITVIDLPVQSFLTTDDGGQLSSDVEVFPGTISGLLTIRCTVRSAAASFTLTRWVVDPIFAAEIEAASSDDDAAADAAL